MKSLFQKVCVCLLFFSISSFAQLTLVSDTNLVTETDIYVNNQNIRYSDLIKIKFNRNIIDLPVGESIASFNDISNIDIKNYLLSLENKYGNFTLEKAIPWTFWGDTIKTHKRTGKEVIVKDMSQIFYLYFTNLVPIDSLINEFALLLQIEWVDGPFQFYALVEPDDEYYGEQWSLQRIQAEQAWDMTTGSPNIKIFIHDIWEFPSSGHTQLHVDLLNKVIYYNTYLIKGHGIQVAGFAGAETDNTIGVASLGWNISLGFHNLNAWAIRDAVDNHNADVLNISYTWDCVNPAQRTAIEYALSLGVVVVASAGNEIDLNNPYVGYPAAYNFGSIGQVIAVSGTKLVNNNELFVNGWNYSPGNDPINDPTNSFIDVAAPGMLVKGLVESANDGYEFISGTSFSAPQVSALAALMLSIDNTLTPPEIYDIITKSAEKIAENQYPYNANGWNQYMGYGRINAFYAVAPPAAPTNVTSYYDSSPSCNTCHEVNGSINIDWDDNIEPDLYYYTVYRSENSGNCSNCHTTSGGAPEDSLEDPNSTNEPVNVSEQCPALAGEVEINGTTMEIETGCESGIEGTETLEFKPIWAWKASYWIDLNIHSDHTYFYYVTASDVVLEQESEISNITSTYIPEGMGIPFMPQINSDITPKIFYLYQNYPNPFNPITNIKYQLPIDSDVLIEIYNVLGERVKTLINEFKESGYYSVNWDGTNDLEKSVSNGIYIYKIIAGTFVNFKKMLLIK